MLFTSEADREMVEKFSSSEYRLSFTVALPHTRPATTPFRHHAISFKWYRICWWHCCFMFRRCFLPTGQRQSHGIYQMSEFCLFVFNIILNGLFTIHTSTMKNLVLYFIRFIYVTSGWCVLFCTGPCRAVLYCIFKLSCIALRSTHFTAWPYIHT